MICLAGITSLNVHAKNFNYQIHEHENKISSLKEDLENMHQKQRNLKEELAERDGQLRVVQMNLETSQKQNQLHAQEVYRKLSLQSQAR